MSGVVEERFLPFGSCRALTYKEARERHIGQIDAAITELRERVTCLEKKLADMKRKKAVRRGR